MELTTRSPFKGLESIYNRFFNTDNPEFQTLMNQEWKPAVDIVEDKDEFTIQAELPEVKKEDIEVSIDNHILTISGQRKYETKDKTQHRIERFYGHFSRSFSLPENVNEESISAEHKNGMLYLHLEKSPQNSSKQISIAIS